MSPEAKAGSAGNGFVFVAVGDCIIARPISDTQGMRSIRSQIQAADIAFANLESSLLDRSEITQAPHDETGAAWAVGSRAVADDLRKIGLRILSRANNHTFDFGLDGARATGRALDAAGIRHAGFAGNRTDACAPQYLDCARGRVACIAAASSFAPQSRAAGTGRNLGRPGVNALRTRRYLTITPQELRTLRRIRDEVQPGLAARPEESADEFDFLGHWFRIGNQGGSSYVMDPGDLREILSSVSRAREQADLVIFSMHSHEPGNWSDQPVSFVRELAQSVIDAGADVFVGHGPHRLRGIQVYRGRPIFYSLANFIFQLDGPETIMSELLEQYREDLGASRSELTALWTALQFDDPAYFESVLASVRFESGHAVEIRLTPIELGATPDDAEFGVPRLASPVAGPRILERLHKLSMPFGTSIEIDNGVGIIRISANVRSTLDSSAEQ
jgi:poly-gamma-glutamate capsule biosynthesis protein CapA/YwtB (metallophosphatase superfamily)